METKESVSQYQHILSRENSLRYDQLIYLNNASTSYPKPDIVIKETMKYMQKPHLSSGRSSLQDDSDDVIEQCRNILAKLFNIDNPACLSFTSGATHSLNWLLKVWI